MKKLTYSFVKNQFELGGYTLLSKEYINSRTKLVYTCEKGNKHSGSWSSWYKGCKRRQCSHRSIVKRISHTYIKKEFEKAGYKLLSDNYVSCFDKLDYVCSNGHKHSIKWNDWQQGIRCPKCTDNAILDIEFIKEQFLNEGYILLSTEYYNNRTKLEYICPSGHINNISYSSWSRGRRCSICNGNKVYTIDIVSKSFRDRGYKLLSKEYKNAHQKLEYVCPVGHRHFITRHEWDKNQGCPTCAVINNSGSNSVHWKGGLSFEPYSYEWTNQLKDSIKERDGNRCLNPDCWRQDKTLSIHHVDYNKKNCQLDNLITICRSCNSRANIDRDWHTAWYQAILSKRYNYKY